jgi:tetratricopeptide (TPR) repeat protein
MRTRASVRLAPRNGLAFLLAAQFFAAIFSLGVRASAFEAAQMPGEVEEPTEMAPDGSEAPPTEAPSGDDAIKPRVLDRSLFRPDLKPGSEDAARPHSAEESKQDRLGHPPDDLPLPSPADRPKVLGELYVQLGKAKDAETAAPLMQAIENLWRATGSPTVDLLIGRAMRFTKEADLDLALAILDSTVAIAPEEAEGWYLRARVHYLQSKYELALADLRRALNRDPQHYRALADLGLVFEALGIKTDAVEAYRKALQVNPFLEDARQAVEFLSREVRFKRDI